VQSYKICDVCTYMEACLYRCTQLWLAGAVNKKLWSEFENDWDHLFFLQEICTEMFSV